jgi:citrate synthase
VLPMFDPAAALADAEKWVEQALARKERIMGFGHRVYRAEDPRSRLLKRTAKELGSPRVEVAEALEQAAHEAIAKKHPDHSYTNVEFWSAIVLDVAEIPPALAPAMFAGSRTAGWSAHVLEQKRLGVLVRPAAKYVGPGARSLNGVG